MKRQYLQWNRDTVDDALITDQLAELSDGRLKPHDGFQYADTQELVNTISAAQGNKGEGSKKKKKKKKKSQAQ